MPKKFDVVIGNPPYQEEAKGSGTRDTPAYHLFMDAAYELGDKAILITPARFLFNAGFTPKAWNEKMLADTHLKVAHYVDNSDKLFPGTDIKGGIAVTYRDASKNGEPIGTFTKYPELNDILQKVVQAGGRSLETVGITSSRSYRYLDVLYDVYPHLMELRPEGNAALVNTNTFEQLADVYTDSQPSGGPDCVRVLGLVQNRRYMKWLRAEYISGPASFDAFKAALPAANGSGVFGEVLSAPIVLGPRTAVTQSFITIGCFETSTEAESCLVYVKTKFARTLLGVLKITQHNPAKVWKYVPAQDFTASSDIDWAKSIPEIDQQLYAKYGLDANEIAFIEDNVKPME